jgi:hypothetical protein
VLLGIRQDDTPRLPFELPTIPTFPFIAGDLRKHPGYQVTATYHTALLQGHGESNKGGMVKVFGRLLGR